jgi:hypothetical protein
MCLIVVPLPPGKNPFAVNNNNKSFDCCLSHFRTSVSTSPSSAKRLPSRLNRFPQKNASHRKQETVYL